jgi:peptidoglycan hydrolase CwlO-like protein
MKKKIFFLVIVLLISISAIAFGNSIDKSLKKIPESAVLL